MRFFFTGASVSPLGRLQWQPTIFSHADNGTIIALERLAFDDGRAITDSFRNALEASASGEVVLIFLTIAHDDLPDTPIRVVSEDQRGVSYLNGLIVNYKYGSQLYLGCPFLMELLTDDDRPPRGTLTVPDVDRSIGINVLALTSAPEITVTLLKLSDFSDAVDGDNARNPTGTPAVEYYAESLFLRNFSGDASMVSADIQSTDLAGEPWPKTRATSDMLPALYAE